jgi:SAM-dependent methyltransferase
MPSDAERWEERYRGPEFRGPTEPAAFLKQLLPILPRGRALDLAAGEGRNAVFLAQYGWHVTAVDFAASALERAAALAKSRGVTAIEQMDFTRTAEAGRLTLVRKDLERTELPIGAFDLVTCFNFLQRRLFGAMAQALRPGGALVYETFTTEQLRYPEGPRNADHLLRPGELRGAFPGLRMLFYAEHNAGKGIASLLARRATR